MRAWLLAAAVPMVVLAGCIGIPEPDPECPAMDVRVTPDGQVAMTWDAAPNATGYRLVRGMDGSEPALYAELPASQTSFMDTNVSRGHDYAYAVIADPSLPLDHCPPNFASHPDASVPFFTGPGMGLAAAGAALGVLLVFLRRR